MKELGNTGPGRRPREEGIEAIDDIPDPEIMPGNGDVRPEVDPGRSPDQPPGGTMPSLEEDDDNPYQGSDDALPDDEEEGRLRRNPTREGGLFDEY
jgi:hypothetical protein